MTTKVYALLHNGTKYATVLGNPVERLKEDKESYSGKVTKALIGVGLNALGTHRNIYFKDLNLNSVEETKTLKQPLLKALLEQDFSNDNTTFFMLERGLVEDCRTKLSEKGKELLHCFKK